MSTHTGIPKCSNEDKGFAFTSCNDGEDVVVHHSQAKEKGHNKDIHEGENVTLNIQKADKP